MLKSIRKSKKRHRPKNPTPAPDGPYQAWSAALKKLHRHARRKKLPPLRQLNEWLDGVPAGQKCEALQDLVAAHLHWSWQTGSATLLDDYLILFPDFDALADLPVELIEDEFLARYQLPHGDFPSLASYRRRFSTRPEVAAHLSTRCLDKGRYLKLRRIGVGAVAVVWKAFDREACREVAIKEPLHNTDAPDQLHPFTNEAKLTQALDHPGIVGMVEVRPRDGGPAFFVMRLVGNTTLADEIQQCHARLADQTKPQPFEAGLRELLEAVARVCDAIDYAHGKGVLHCDLKPENVARNDHGDIAVIDWGLAAKIATQETGKRTPADPQRRLAGTPHYMAPEQMDGIIDTRTEVFGLGGILYETLTAQPPYCWTEGGVEKRPDDWAECIHNGKYPPPRNIRRAIPKALEAICLKAMARDPEERYHSPGDLARAIRQHLRGPSKPPYY